MKIKLLLSFFVMVLSYSACYASFPVKRAHAEAKTTEIANNTLEEEYMPLAAVKAKDKWVGAALWFLLGWPFAAHRWYYNKPVWANILFIITIGGLGIWAIIDIINILTDKWN